MLTSLLKLPPASSMRELMARLPTNVDEIGESLADLSQHERVLLEQSFQESMGSTWVRWSRDELSLSACATSDSDHEACLPELCGSAYCSALSDVVG